MAEENKKPGKNEPRRLGEYLTCSPGSIVMAIKKKLIRRKKRPGKIN